MYMKTLPLILLLLISGLINSIAQEKKHKGEKFGEKREKIKAQKIAFITGILDLTPEEAQVFWPVYNEYNKKLDELTTDKMKIMKDANKKLAEMTEKEAELLGDKIVEFEISEASLLKEYHSKFKKVLPKTKILQLYQAEHKFKKQLLRDMKGRHHVEKGDQGTKKE